MHAHMVASFQRFRFLTPVLGAILAFLALTIGALPAGVAGQAGSGSISGTVTDAGGSPLAGISVQLYSFVVIGYLPLGSPVITDAQGDYTISGLATGTYRVAFSDPGGVYAAEAYNDKSGASSGDNVNVIDGEETTGIDAILEATGSISGTVTDPSATALAGIVVVVYQEEQAGWALTGLIQTTDASGGYEISGLAPGIYRLGFTDPFVNYLPEFYDGAADVETATDITVIAGQTTANIDVQLDAVPGSISGTVTGPGGEAVDKATAAAYRFDTQTGLWTIIAFDLTDASGDYRIEGLAAGVYRVQFVDNSGNASPEYYDNAADVTSASDVSVTAGQDTPNINAQLATGGSISGTVTGPTGAALADVTVLAYKEEQAIWIPTGLPQITDAGGNYTISGLASGAYRVQFVDNTDVHLSEYYDNAADVTSASDVSVTAGQDTPNINAQLTTGGSISGTVTGADGTPLPGIPVQLYVFDADRGDWFVEPALTRLTDANGDYTVGGLTSGTYRVAFIGNLFYRGEFYDNAADVGSATDVSVTVGQPTANINAQLARTPDGGPILAVTKASTYQIRNNGSSPATVVQTFYSGRADSSGTIVYATSSTIPAGGSQTVVLQSIDQLPADYSGDVVIVADQPIQISQPPTAISLSNASLAEDAAVGTTVGTLSTIDPDSGDSHSFSLVAGDGDSDNAAFSIDGVELKTAQGFDYETKNSYSVRVRATDLSGLTYEDNFTISVTDVPEGPVLVTSNGSLGSPGSSFGFEAAGFAPNSIVDITVGLQLPARRLAALEPTTVSAGSVRTDESGTARFSLVFNASADLGTYNIVVSDGTSSATTQVTLDVDAPKLTAPEGAPVLRAQPTVYLPLVRR